MFDDTRGVLWYRKDRQLLADNQLLVSLRRCGINTIAYVSKDYNGEWIGRDELALLSSVKDRYGFEIMAWICCMTEGYSGELAASSVSPLFTPRKWSVVDSRGRDCSIAPVHCDLGQEQYACPSNRNHTAYLVDGLVRLHRVSLFSGIVCDLVRFPLSLEWCFCDSCRAEARDVLGVDLDRATGHERFRLKQHVVAQIAEQLAHFAPNVNTTFLVWPRLKLPDLTRHQDYRSWNVRCISPMLYLTIADNPVRLNRSVEEHWDREILPLFLADAPLLESAKKHARDWSSFLLTHYGLSGTLSSDIERTIATPLTKVRRIAYPWYAGLRYAIAYSEHALIRSARAKGLIHRQ